MRVHVALKFVDLNENLTFYHEGRRYFTQRLARGIFLCACIPLETDHIAFVVIEMNE